MENFDVVVIGAGPGGYVCAIKAAQLGLKTAVVEKEYLGGVCLNVGCIPSKAMITAAHHLHKAQHDFPAMGLQMGPISVDFPKMVGWKKSVCDRMASGVSALLKGNGVQVFMGEAQFKTPQELEVKSSAGATLLKAKYFVLAMGSRPIEIPGFAFDEKEILSSTGALSLTQIPERLAVIGGGYIGLEISGYMQKLGSQVTVVEAGSQLLQGVADPECAQAVERKLKKLKVEILMNSQAQKAVKTKKGFELTLSQKGETKTIQADKILVTVGRRPNSDSAQIQKIGIALDAKGFVKVDAQRRTNLAHIFSIGDLAGQPMLAHKASYEGLLVAEVIAGKNRVYDAKTVPAVVFTDPEIASAGLLESEAKDRGHQVKVAKFPFAANGRAVSMIETEGFVKMIADAQTDVLLGVHIVGPEASNLISEAALAIEMGARLQDIAGTIHPHPTLGETMMEAAEATLGHAIHMIQKPLSR